MLVLQKVIDIKNQIAHLKKQRKQIGFVPTMGALHAGHLALVKQAAAENDVVIVSIFVNPTQFNNVTDLEKYPRTPERDIDLLSTTPAAIVFMPSTEEVYISMADMPMHNFNFNHLDKVLEGEFRPGHFDGMSRVVNRLLQIIEPNNLYMGLKDFQQFTIVKSMLKQARSKVNLIPGETLRENDGLAMSSRNTRLTPEQRAVAPKIYSVLKDIQERATSITPKELELYARDVLNTEPQFRVEYLVIVDGKTLLPIQKFSETDFAVALVAVFIGDVRLIDNIILKKPKNF